MLPKYRRQEHRLRDSYKEQDCYEETGCRREQIGLNETPTNTKPVGVYSLEIFGYPFHRNYAS